MVHKNLNQLKNMLFKKFSLILFYDKQYICITFDHLYWIYIKIIRQMNILIYDYLF